MPDIGFSEMCCGECGITFHVPSHFYTNRKDNGAGWCCPNGHSRVFRESDVDKQRRRAERAEQSIAHYQEQIEVANRSVAAHKGQITKLKNRAKAGVCLCCNRTFQNLARHMKTKHPNMESETPLKVIEGGVK